MTATGSKRDRIRDIAEDMMRRSGGPLHNTALADGILPRLAAGESATAKDVNTALHDDPLDRFERVGKGTWTLRKRR